MSQKLKNKIEATDTSINKLLKDQKFTIDYFQREYNFNYVLDFELLEQFIRDTQPDS